VCITTNQPDHKSNPNPDPNPNPTTKQQAIVNIHLNIVTCYTYPDRFIRDNVVAPFVRLSIVIVKHPLGVGVPHFTGVTILAGHCLCRRKGQLFSCGDVSTHRETPRYDTTVVVARTPTLQNSPRLPSPFDAPTERNPETAVAASGVP